MDRYVNANAVFSKFSRDYMQLKKDLPIRPSEMGVLNIITRREGQFTPLMIAELLGVSKPMIAAHISVLEEKGYIYKAPSPNDKRSFYVTPTDQAKALVEAAEAKSHKQLRAMENKLGKDNFDLLLSLLQPAQDILEETGAL